MSAWIVSKAHIDRMVSTATAWHIVPTDKSNTDLGRMLWEENLKSVAYRYPRDGSGQRPGPAGLTDDDIHNYRYHAAAELAPAEALKASQCLDYQSCEHDGWRDSEARKFLDVFEAEALRQGGGTDSPEYERAPWGFE